MYVHVYVCMSIRQYLSRWSHSENVEVVDRFRGVFSNWLQGSRWTWASYTEDPRDLDAFVDGRLELASRKWLLVLLFYARRPVGTLCTFPGCYFLDLCPVARPRKTQDNIQSSPSPRRVRQRYNIWYLVDTLCLDLLPWSPVGTKSLPK